MAGKTFALLCVLLVAASCFYSAEGWRRRRRRRNPPPPTICCRHYLVCFTRLGRCYIIRHCFYCNSAYGKRSLPNPDDGIIECVPSDLSAVDYNKDGRVSYHEFVVAMTLDENNSTSRDAFDEGDDNGK